MGAEFDNKDSFQKAKELLARPDFSLDDILKATMPSSGGRPAGLPVSETLADSAKILRNELSLSQPRNPSQDQLQDAETVKADFAFMYGDLSKHFDVNTTGPYVSADGEVYVIVDISTRDANHYSVIPDLSRVFESPSEEDKKRGNSSNEKGNKKKLIIATESSTPEFSDVDDSPHKAPTLPKHEEVTTGRARLLIGRSTQEGEFLHIQIHAPSASVRDELANNAIKLVAVPDSSRSSCVLDEIVRQTSRIVNERSSYMYGEKEVHPVEALRADRVGATTHLVETVPVVLENDELGGPLTLEFVLDRAPGALVSISLANGS